LLDDFNGKQWLRSSVTVCYTYDMSVTWRRQKSKKYHSTVGWDLLVNDVRVGCAVLATNDQYAVIHRGKHWHKMYPSMSGARMQLERLAGVQTEWAQQRRAKMPLPLTPEEHMWKILSQ